MNTFKIYTSKEIAETLVTLSTEKNKTIDDILRDLLNIKHQRTNDMLKHVDTIKVKKKPKKKRRKKFTVHRIGNANSALSVEEIVAVRKVWIDSPKNARCSTIAAMFGVTDSTINNIVMGHTWVNDDHAESVGSPYMTKRQFHVWQNMKEHTNKISDNIMLDLSK